jgi:hypothetical protein
MFRECAFQAMLPGPYGARVTTALQAIAQKGKEVHNVPIGGKGVPVMKLRGSGDIIRTLLEGGWSLAGGWGSSSWILWREPYECAPDFAAR